MRNVLLVALVISTLGVGSVAVAAPKQSAGQGNAGGGGGQGNAQGTPQRDPRIPPGLAGVLERNVPGILRARLATVGSNSRLQDLPVSP
jgi:hypothetical protein